MTREFIPKCYSRRAPRTSAVEQGKAMLHFFARVIPMEKSRLPVSLFLLLVAAPGIYGQGRGAGRGGRGAQPPQTPKAAAPVDLTGYWVANVTTDWRWRMTVPPKGDYRGLPLNEAGRKLA